MQMSLCFYIVKMLTNVNQANTATAQQESSQLRSKAAKALSWIWRKHRSRFCNIY